MAKTSLDIDHGLARRAKEVLGTRTLRETVNAALQDVVDSRRRLELIELLRDPGRFDFDAAESAWGGQD